MQAHRRLNSSARTGRSRPGRPAARGPLPALRLDARLAPGAQSDSCDSAGDFGRDSGGRVSATGHGM
jgi:hypothetical protein